MGKERNQERMRGGRTLGMEREREAELEELEAGDGER